MRYFRKLGQHRWDGVSLSPRSPVLAWSISGGGVMLRTDINPFRTQAAAPQRRRCSELEVQTGCRQTCERWQAHSGNEHIQWHICYTCRHWEEGGGVMARKQIGIVYPSGCGFPPGEICLPCAEQWEEEHAGQYDSDSGRPTQAVWGGKQFICTLCGQEVE